MLQLRLRLLLLTLPMHMLPVLRLLLWEPLTQLDGAVQQTERSRRLQKQRNWLLSQMRQRNWPLLKWQQLSSWPYKLLRAAA